MSDTANQNTLYDRIGGAETIDRLVDRFYARMDSLPEASVIRAMHADDLKPVGQTLKVYLAEWLGGPKNYSVAKGHPRLRQRHLHVRIGIPERDAWLLCMNGALRESVQNLTIADEIYASIAKLADWMRNQAGNPHDSR